MLCKVDSVDFTNSLVQVSMCVLCLQDTIPDAVTVTVIGLGPVLRELLI